MFGLRKATWALLFWNALMGWWYLQVLFDLGGPCAAEGPGAMCQISSTIGAVLGLLVLGGIWLVGYLAFAFAWFMTRPYVYE